MSREKQKQARRQADAGFSILEALVVVAVMAILAGLVIPRWMVVQRYLRVSGDARGLAGSLNVAKMRAGSDFTRTRVFVFTGANPFYRVDIWNKTAACWIPDSALQLAANCIGGNTAPGGYATSMSQGVTPGISGVGAAPPLETGAALAQAPACGDSAGGTIGNTACVVFNSRGFPVDNAGAPVAAPRSFYITDNNLVYNVTVNSMGLIHVWSTDANGNGAWAKR
jgi:Tfp pilus assembly protein FimT